ncbi:MAG: tRNA (N6-isopentenyl adenosine(37)-C2)-methylthiotransferase MiaB [bacterium]|nr:tRNA (N6-isopentenyl adenosine(37)-C2)-methylthiotransferase MiaB [bacterium]
MKGNKYNLGLNNPKLYIRTFGCQMNDYDSILIAESLAEFGYSLTSDIKQADLILFNTCAVRGLAEHKAVSELGTTRRLKEKKPNLVVGMIGCVAQKLGKDLARKYSFIDFVLGTKDMYKLSEFLKVKESKPLIQTNLNYEIKGYQTKKVDSVSAYVTVVRGCTHFCTYCIVPYVRGKEESRSLYEIEEEIKTLVGNGVKEIVLLGQNVNVYGNDIDTNLETLLLNLSAIDDLKRIRYLTSHPKSVNAKFIESVKDIPKVCTHIHIPFQSGSDTILKKMNRQHTCFEYIEKVKLLRKSIPNIGITSDIIVGFPGETEEDFLATVSVLEECRLDNVYSFKYSPREGTIAFKNMLDDVSKQEKERRLEYLHQVTDKIALEINEGVLGQTQEVLWENIKEYQGKEVLEGRTNNFKKIFSDFQEGKVGTIDTVKILKVTKNSLVGESI